MRTIKFRGKTIRSKEWVYSSTISQGTIKRKANKWFMEISENVWKGLQEGSLGQFTGLYDKDGKEIYEGDIVRWEDNNGDDRQDSVKWNNGDVGYILNESWLMAEIHTYEVIGNIYESPELIEKGG